MRDSIDLVIPAYNVAGIIECTLQRVAEQVLPERWSLTVYVSDDGSSDGTRDILDRLATQYPFMRTVVATQNRGRSAACNGGIRAGTGSIVAICDADCRYTRPDVLAEFAGEIEAGADAVIGAAELAGDGFWARYMNSLIRSRGADETEQGLVAWSTPNIAVRRDVMHRLGGYSEAYRQYGFEDKDFLIRLDAISDAVRVRPDLRVSHDDDLSLDVMCRKFEEAGRHSAPIFRTAHPAQYEKLAYRHCDATRSGLGRLLGPAAAVFHSLLQGLAAGLLRMPVGFALQRLAVRTAVCAAYFKGTADSRHAG